MLDEFVKGDVAVQILFQPVDGIGDDAFVGMCEIGARRCRDVGDQKEDECPQFGRLEARKSVPSVDEGEQPRQHAFRKKGDAKELQSFSEQIVENFPMLASVGPLVT